MECLESLKKNSYSNYEVLVVDNGSTGNDADVLEQKYKDYAKVIRNAENLGFTGGNNSGIVYALKEQNPPEYIFLLNNDTEMEKDCLTNLVNVAQQTKAGITGAVIKDIGEDKAEFVGLSAQLAQFRLLRTVSLVHKGMLQRNQ